MRSKRVNAPYTGTGSYSSWLPSGRSVLTEIAREAGKVALRKMTQPSKKKSYSGVSGSKTIRVNAGSNFRKSKGKRRRTKKNKVSLSKRVKTLEKNNGPKSIYDKHYSLPYWLPNGSTNSGQKTLYFVPTNAHAECESVVSSITIPGATGVDLNATTLNTKYKVKNFCKFTIKNGALYGIHVKYVAVQCGDNTSTSPMTAYRDWLLDRELAVGTTVVSATPAAIGSARIPESLVHVKVEASYDFLSACYNSRSSSWKKQGSVGVNHVYLQPGESFDVYSSCEYTYSPENRDSHAFTYLSDSKDSGIMISTYGEIGHGTAAENDQIGHLSGQLDCKMMKKYSVSIDNGAGIHKILWSDEMNTQTSAANFEVAGVQIVEQ